MNSQSPENPEAPSGGAVAHPSESGTPSRQRDDLQSKSPIPIAPKLSLPKGGGAIRGIGEKFDVDSSTGTGSVSISVPTSAGRGGMQPTLSLRYDSGSGNGPFGIGWSLSGQPSITRKTSKGLPQYQDDIETDVFLLSGAEDLVPSFKRDANNNIVMSEGKPVVDDKVLNGFLIRRYRPRIETTFIRVERWARISDPEDIHWRTITGTNITTVFGASSSSRIYNYSGTENQDALQIFSWLAAETYDTEGNAMIYTYKDEDSVNVSLGRPSETNRTDATRKNNRYLKSIRYGNMTPNRQTDTWEPFSASTLPENNWKFSVILDYGDHNLEEPDPGDTGDWTCRSDAFSDYHAGFEIRTYRLCQRILMFHHFEELGRPNYLVGSLDLAYDLNSTATYLLGATRAGYSLGGDGKYTKVPMAPVMFEYSRFPTDEEVSRVLPQRVDRETLHNVSVADGSTYQWVDLNSEGLSGLLTEQGGAWFYKRNTSANNIQETASGKIPVPRFEELEIVLSKPSVSIAGGQGTALFGDVAGAGKLDLIQTSPTAWGYFERDSNFEEWEAFREFKRFPNISLADPGTEFVDLTGDGLPDILIQADQLYCWYPSLGSDGYGPGKTVTQPLSEKSGPVCVASDTEKTIYLADMSGDGLSDIVRIRNGDVCYWPNLGYGRFGAMVTMDNAPWFDYSDNFSGRNIRLADIDGSMTTDIIYLGAGGVSMYLNESGNGFSAAKRLTSFPPIDKNAIVNTIDLLGNGTTCLTWSSPLPGIVSAPLVYADLLHGKKPHLLTRVINNLGSETRIQYAPSTKFYLQDEREGNPWISRLPFPVHCVESVEVVDHVSRNRFKSLYRYHHGYFDGVEREFRGFAMVEVRDAEQFSVASSSSTDKAWYVPPTLTKSWYHTGIYAGGEVTSRHLANEYFGAPTSRDDQAMDVFLKTLLPDTVTLADTLPSDVSREASRALKGRLLRTEVYLEDEGPKAHIPYSTKEINYTVEITQGRQDVNNHSVFQVHDRESIECHLERQLNDSRIQHHIILQVNEYGQTQKELRIAYGRQPGKSTLDSVTRAKQETTQFVYTETDYTNAIELSEDFHHPVSCETRLYELSKLPISGDTQRVDILGLMTDDFSVIRSLAEIPFEQANDSSKWEKRLIKRGRTLYRRNDLTAALAVGTIESLVIPWIHYDLALTPGLVTNVFKMRTPEGAIKSLLPSPPEILGGTNSRQAGYVDLDNDGSWWVPSSKASFHPNPLVPASEELQEAKAHFFLPQSFIDPFSNKSSAMYDPYSLFTIVATDPQGNSLSTEIDYRVLEPKLLIDANGNRSAVAFDALGRVVGTALMGKASESLGDSLTGFQTDVTEAQLIHFFADPRGPNTMSLLGSATTRTIYDDRRYYRDSTETKPAPAYISIIIRENHMSDETQTGNPKIQVSIAYSDGFERVIQSRGQCKPGPLLGGTNEPVAATRWIVSGWKIQDNKANIIKEYEPFFDNTHDFKPDTTVGVSTLTLHDPLGRVVTKLRPDHGIEKTVIGVWEQKEYDANDNVLLSDPRLDTDVGHYFVDISEDQYIPSWYNARIQGQLGPQEKASAEKIAAHSNTPTTAHFDANGTTVLTIIDNGSFGLFQTRTDVDIEEKETAIFDARGRAVMRYTYDMCGVRICQASMDSATRWSLYDVLGNPLYVWNSRDLQSRLTYDTCRRHVEVWLKDSATEVLVQRNVYGESLSPDPETRNQRGHVVRIEDQAGVSISEEFDFKGNVTRGSRQFATEYKTRVDWSKPVALEDAIYTCTYTFDALNRTIQTVHADNSVVRHLFDETGQFNQVIANLKGEQGADPADWTRYISGVDYNAKLQNTSISWGNGITTERSYDPLTFRLSHLVSARASATGRTMLQDLAYLYDPVGNVTYVRDDCQQTSFFRNRLVDPSSSYTYDPAYRLLEASGREHLGQTNRGINQPAAPTASDPTHTGLVHPGDGNAMGRYTEHYTYDTVGNILSVAHQGSDPSSPGWTRRYAYESDSLIDPGQKNNRLTSTSVGNTTENYGYVGSAGITGNMTSMPHLQSLEWDYKDQLQSTTKQIVNGSATPETTYYVYDAGGKRLRKVTERFATEGSMPTALKDRRYIGELEVFRRYAGDGTTVVLERTTLRITDTNKQVALTEIRTQGSDSSPERLTRYQLDNHHGSAVLELDDEARILTYEEYYAFGGTAYQAMSNQTECPKRYRYTGKERDEESGLHFYGARYYAAWLGRWTAADPAGLEGGINLYAYVKNNPTSSVDPTGNWDIKLSDVARGALTAAVGIVVVAAVATAVVATGGAILAPLATAAATAAFGATTGAAVVSGAGAVITTGIAVAGVAMGAKATVNTFKEVVTGKNAETGEDLTDRQRSEKLGALPVEALATAVGMKGLRNIGGGGGATRSVPMKVKVPKLDLEPNFNGTASSGISLAPATVNVPVLAPQVAVGIASSAPLYMTGAGGGGGGGGGGGSAGGGSEPGGGNQGGGKKGPKEEAGGSEKPPEKVSKEPGPEKPPEPPAPPKATTGPASRLFKKTLPALESVYGEGNVRSYKMVGKLKKAIGNKGVIKDLESLGFKARDFKATIYEVILKDGRKVMADIFTDGNNYFGPHPSSHQSNYRR